jgi:hypothetical protein
MATATIATVAALILRCGSDDEEKAKSQTPAVSAGVPAGWDGMADWIQSTLQFKDQ